MISDETIKCTLFASRVTFSWHKIQSDPQKIIQYFYEDFVKLFVYKESDEIIDIFTYNGEIGVIGVIIFDKMVKIFKDHGLLYKEYPDLSIDISKCIIERDYHLNLNSMKLSLILDSMLKIKDKSNITNIVKIIRKRREWKNGNLNLIDLDLLQCYKKSLLTLIQVCNEESVLFIPKYNFFTNVISTIYPRYWFTNYKYINNTSLLSHPIYNFMISKINIKDKKITLNYSEGITSGILLYFLWLARENNRIDTLYVVYIEESSNFVPGFASKSFIRRICTENLIPLRIRIMKELSSIKELRSEYKNKVKIELLLDLENPVISAQKLDTGGIEMKNVIYPLEYFSVNDKLYLAENYKIPYDCIEECEN